MDVHSTGFQAWCNPICEEIRLTVHLFYKISCIFSEKSAVET